MARKFIKGELLGELLAKVSYEDCQLPVTAQAFLSPQISRLWTSPTFVDIS